MFCLSKWAQTSFFCDLSYTPWKKLHVLFRSTWIIYLPSKIRNSHLWLYVYFYPNTKCSISPSFLGSALYFWSPSDIKVPKCWIAHLKCLPKCAVCYHVMPVWNLVDYFEWICFHGILGSMLRINIYYSFIDNTVMWYLW